MRKTIVTLVALCAAMAVNATVLRVSNVSGSTAPYSTVQAALDAATEGDTIMLDASGKDYGGITIKKRIALIGPGYWLQNNGIIQEGGSYASVNGITVEASGVIICGLYLPGYNNRINVKKGNTNVVIKRNYIGGGIYIDSNSDRCVIHQNFLMMNDYLACIGGSYTSSYHQITNNIIRSGVIFRDIHDSYIAYNTILGKGEISTNLSSNLTFEKNIWYQQPANATSNFSDNIIAETTFDSDKQIDKDVKAMNLSTTHGAFAGDSPYVLSGVPSAPVIEDLVVPTTVEYGSNMNVTIKLNIQK